MVLLPTATSKLLAQWQGPYQVVKRMGKVTYMVDMHDHRKRRRVFHVNMLKTFQIHRLTESSYLGCLLFCGTERNRTPDSAKYLICGTHQNGSKTASQLSSYYIEMYSKQVALIS